MGFLFLIFVGLLAMIMVARFAARIKGKKPEPDSGGYTVHAPSPPLDATLQKGLISLLLKKEVIREEELLEEIQKIKNNSGM